MSRQLFLVAGVLTVALPFVVLAGSAAGPAAGPAFEVLRGLIAIVADVLPLIGLVLLARRFRTNLPVFGALLAVAGLAIVLGIDTVRLLVAAIPTVPPAQLPPTIVLASYAAFLLVFVGFFMLGRHFRNGSESERRTGLVLVRALPAFAVLLPVASLTAVPFAAAVAIYWPLGIAFIALGLMQADEPVASGTAG